MDEQRKSPFEFSIEELDREIIARGAQVPDEKKFTFKDKEGTPERGAVMNGVGGLYKTPPPHNEALSHVDTWDLARVLIFKTQPSLDFTRGSGTVELLEWHEIMDDPTLKNVKCVAAICMKDDLVPVDKGFFTLKVKNYGKTFNLCDNELFRDQPVVAGHICSGFLVKEDVIATSSLFIAERNVTDIRVIFGYKMVDSCTAVTRFPADHIYSGVEIIRRAGNPANNKGGWMLVKLDRKVEGHEVATLSRDEIYCDQEIYTLGHPMGLPLKYASGAFVGEKITGTHFTANLSLYAGGVGSPVFDLNTNEVIGMVVNAPNYDFRWVEKGWMSVQNPDGPGTECVKASAIKMKFLATDEHG